MNIAVRVATQNAINTSMMAAQSAARRSRNYESGPDGEEWGWPEFLVILIVGLLFGVVICWGFWEVLTLCFG